MSEIDPARLAALRAMAEAWLKRPMTAEEVQVLETFVRNQDAQGARALPGAMAGRAANPVTGQQGQNTLTQAATNQGVMQIYGLDTTAAAGATEKIAQAGVADNLTSLLEVLKAFGPPR